MKSIQSDLILPVMTLARLRRVCQKYWANIMKSPIRGGMEHGPRYTGFAASPKMGGEKSPFWSGVWV